MKIARALIAILSILATSAPGIPQVTSFSGIVRDSNGQPVAGAKVTLKFESSSVSASASTNSEGYFYAANLPPGDYTCIVEAAGFSTIAKSPIGIPSDVQPFEINLQRLPSSEGIEVSSDVRLETLTTSTLITLQPRHDSLLVTIFPGFSFKVISDSVRPLIKIPTAVLLAQFAQLRQEYPGNQSKAETKAERLYSALIVRKAVGASLKAKLRRFDTKYGTHLSGVTPLEGEDFPKGTTEALVGQLDAELQVYSRHYDTLVRLRRVVPELVRRQEFGSSEAKEYFNFLSTNDLTGREVAIPLVEDVSYDPLKILSFQEDLQLSLKRLTSPSRVWISHSGIALGFLEADPAESTQQLIEPQGIRISRKFVPITGSIADPALLYKIDLRVDWSDLPPGVSQKTLTPQVQEIAKHGQLLPAYWDFKLDAPAHFTPFSLHIRGELEKYTADGRMAFSQQLTVPISVVRVLPSPTTYEKIVAVLARNSVFITISSFLVGLLGLTYGHDRARADAKKLVSMAAAAVDSSLSEVRKRVGVIVTRFRRRR